jgi:Uma2 family endonuclease
VKIESLSVVRPATGVPGPPQGRWTYEDVRALPDDGNRYEVLNGVLYVAPGPSVGHQRCVFRVSVNADRFVREQGLGEWFIAPLDLVMPGATPVQPDAIFVASGNTRLTDEGTHLQEIPDLLVEVASPSTAGFDRREKQDAYARAGVPEYWIIDPAAATIEVLVREGEGPAYRSLGVFGGSSRLPSGVLPGLPYAVAELFA